MAVTMGIIHKSLSTEKRWFIYIYRAGVGVFFASHAQVHNDDNTYMSPPIHKVKR